MQLFNYTIKMHYLMEIALMAPFLQPAKSWCYGSESFLQHVRRLVSRCGTGTGPYRVGEASLEMYLDSLVWILGGKLVLKRPKARLVCIDLHDFFDNSFVKCGKIGTISAKM